MEKNVIITISRQFGSNGREIARKLAEYLDISYYNKQILEKIAVNMGVCADFFKDQKQDENGLFTIESKGLLGLRNITELSVNTQIYDMASDFIQKISQREDAVIVGRCADYILKDISFVIEPGEKVAFVGATGAGKSSILNLIGRYFDIQKGEILIDGVNIKDIDTDVLRAAIGQVQQDVFIFTGDIKSNISLDNENISIEDVKRAAEIVHADSFIEKMPGGYDAPVTERGSTLSAGQRQLLSFARTLAYDPTILVLDEATANIDTETEALITSALAKLMEGRTTIMVAHRLSTIQHADKIIVMHQGQIKEAGTHQELLAQNGLYRKLYDLQLVEA